MSFAPRRARISLSILALCSASTTACVGTPPIVTTLAAIDCSKLIPDSYRQPVPPAPPLRVGSTVGDLATTLDGQTARLDQANGRTADVVKIVDVCHDRQAAVLAKLQPPSLIDRLRFWRR